MRIRQERTLWVAASASLLWVILPSIAAGQSMQVHVGAVVPTESRMGGGPYIGLGAQISTPKNWLIARVSGGIGFVENHTSIIPEGELTPQSVIGVRAERQNAYDINLSLLAGRPDGRLQPYVLAGIGYYRFEGWNEGEPLLYGAGINTGVGLAVEVMELELGVEVGLRIFGGYLGGTSGERTYAPITFTIGW